MIGGILASLIPVGTEFVRSAAPAISRKLFGESVEDQLKLENAQIERLKVVAQLDNPGGTPSQWVVDLRGSFRYVAAAGLIVGGLATVITGVYRKDAAITMLGIDLATEPFGFVFGERMVLKFKGQS